ncbi:MAG TPA: hypothetical protein VGM50_17660 [Gemmatimonadaceae bacterium]
MRRFLAARGGRAATRWLLLVVLVVISLVRPASAQTWNDARTLELVRGATQRRVEQLADTGLTDFQATAHGYVTFLAQLGEGFLTPPKVIKADELVDEVYWRAPNLSKQRIVGRRDTLLLPTDIRYHMDHLGIVQNNFANIIRIGDGGDEVADVPHPLSPAGLMDYDFALTDSFAIGAGQQRIRVYEVKVRPKDDRQPRVVGAVYLDASGGQVARMNLTFTRGAFLDKALEDLSLVLENRLVGGRFWLPSRQQIEIRRSGEYLDYPVRGIIRGRWEIGDYKFNQMLPSQMFVGEEVQQMPAQLLAHYPWTGNVLDSLPPDVRAVNEPDIERVQAEARQMVRAQALRRPSGITLSARSASDLVHVDRVEGLAVGYGLAHQFGGGLGANVRARYGIDDKQVKGAVGLSLATADGITTRLFASRDFRDVGDVAERSSAVNSLAAQEFGSDYTDPYLVRALGLSVETPAIFDFHPRITGSYESQSPLAVNATPVIGDFERTIPAFDFHASRFALDLERPVSLWYWGTELSVRGNARVTWPLQNSAQFTVLPIGATPIDRGPITRGAVSATLERPFDAVRLATSASIAGVTGSYNTTAPQELVYLGGPISAPGYDYHSLVSTFGYTGHVELRVPAPFPAFSLGRYGRVPGRGAFAPYVHAAGVRLPGGGEKLFPAVGAAYITPFDLLRLDVARGLSTGGRWTFNIDVSREFWSIL